MNRTNRTSSAKANSMARIEQERGQNPMLMAAAFQDHLVRSMTLTNAIGPRKVLPGRATQMRMKKEIKPLVDTGRHNRPLKKKTDADQEFVLDHKPPPLTLAQKLGLVEAPSQLLSENDWRAAKALSNKREDSHLPCVICKEDFGLQQQVLLSCTHVFHRACLEAFERFTGKKTCPMCRKEQYQTRVIHEGAKQHRVRCATMIQAVWRGYVVRCWYMKVREMVPPKDPGLRKKFFEDKLETITDRMVRSCDFNVNSFLSEIDRSLEASREVFRNFDAMFQQISEEDWEGIQLKAVERGETDCPICLTSLHESETEDKIQDMPFHQNPSNRTQNKSCTSHASNSSKGRPSVSHGTVISKAARRSNSSMSGSNTRKEAFFPKASISSPSKKGVGKHGEGCEDYQHSKLASTSKKRHSVLLSCSHVFHQTCLETFEELTLGQMQNLCPVCRTSYQKRVLEL